MARLPRIVPDNFVQHVINRGNRRETIFRERADFEDFFCLLADTQERVPMRILDVCAMSNHFHIVFWPECGGDLSAYMCLLMNLQIPRLQRRHGLRGLGHIYQGRFRNFTVQNDIHLYRVLRYVLANPVRAGIVDCAEKYPWSSLSMPRTPHGRDYLTPWPVGRPPDWHEYVNRGIAPFELESLRTSTRRGTPYGDEAWVQKIVETYGLESTIRNPGRRRSA